MNAAEMVTKLGRLADDYDDEADRLFKKARRNGTAWQLDQSRATSARADASFIRNLADAIDDLPWAAAKALERRLR